MTVQPPASSPPPSRGDEPWWAGFLKGLTLTNVLIIALMAVIAVPVYIVWKAVNDEKLLDRLMSTYEEIAQSSGCTLRHAKERGGPDLWSVSSGFAFQGIDRWHVSVVVDHLPTDDELVSYCASLKLIADRMLDRGRPDPGGGNGGGDPAEVLRGPVPGAPADGSRHNGNMPAPSQAPAQEEAR